MTPEQLAAIKARCAAATPGPWVATSLWSRAGMLADPNEFAVSTFGRRGGDDTFIATARETEQQAFTRGFSEAPTNEGPVGLRWVDAVFIAGAREDVPALVAEVERLRALLAQVCEDVG